MEIKLSKAEIRARNVLEECGLNDPSEIELREIILGRGAFYEEKPQKRKDGTTISARGRSIITINSNIPFVSRKRFAEAHELGHYEMHRHLVPMFIDTEYDMDNWYKAGPQETEANEFASEFLMPSELFAKECERKKFNPSVIDHLSNRFQVSKTAALLKFVKAGNHPVFVICCKDNILKWWKKSDDFRYFMEHQCNLPPPEGTVAYEMFTSKTFYKDEERAQPIWKSDWFKMRDDERDSRFYEFCLYVKSYNYTLSVIWED